MRPPLPAENLVTAVTHDLREEKDLFSFEDALGSDIKRVIQMITEKLCIKKIKYTPPFSEMIFTKDST